MGVPTSEVGYTSAMPRREDHEVRKGHVGHWWGGEYYYYYYYYYYGGVFVVVFFSTKDRKYSLNAREIFCGLLVNLPTSFIVWF